MLPSRKWPDNYIIEQPSYLQSRRNALIAICGGVAIPSVIGGAWWMFSGKNEEEQPEQQSEARLSTMLPEVTAWCHERSVAIKDSEKKRNFLRTKELCHDALHQIRKELVGKQVRWQGKVDSVDIDGISHHIALPKGADKYLVVHPFGKLTLPIATMRRLNKSNSVLVTAFVNSASMPAVGVFHLYLSAKGDERETRLRYSTEK